MTTKLRIAMVLGDPAGIGPEIVAKVLADATLRQPANIILIADRAETEQGMGYAGVRFPYSVIASPDAFNEAAGDVPALYDFRGDTSGAFALGQPSEAGGRYCLDTLKVAISLAQAGKVDGIAYAPLNKTSPGNSAIAARSVNSMCWTTSGPRASPPMWRSGMCPRG